MVRPPSAAERTYTRAEKRRCGVTLSGAATTWPRRTASRGTPRSSNATLSPASASDIGLPKVSRPVTTVPCVPDPAPSTCTRSPTRIRPRSTAPVTTVPRPVMVSTFSTGSRNGASVYRSGVGTYVSTASSSASTEAVQRGSPSSAFSPDTRTTGAASPP